jgi:acetylglutamate kinase
VNNSSSTPSDPAQVVLTFLESIGQRSDAELYLGLFRKLPKESFALVVVDAQVASSALGSLVEQLRFLADLGLFAPVVLGAFRSAKGQSDARRLHQQLPQVGLKAALHDADEPQLAEALRSELRSEVIPLIHFSATSEGDPSSRWSRLGQLARALETRKIVVLRPQGGLRPRAAASVTLVGDEVTPGGGGRGISVVNLRTDLAALQQGSALLARDSELLRLAHDVLQAAPEPRFAISVTSPLNMLRELFTVRGAGTLIKAGAKIERFDGYGSLDVTRLQQLLESTFGKRLEGTFWQRPVLGVYLEHEYRGTAILQPSPLAPFLSKFAVSRPAQGEGIGRDLWAAVTREFPKLYWRAKQDNPIITWYQSHCHGMAKSNGWTVFWRGFGEQEIPALVQAACALPEDFSPLDPAK